MKRTNYLIRLDDPCPEPWDAMHPTATGRFCQNCAKNVIDFTGITDDQVLAILKTSQGTLCGRVEATQLNRYLVSRTETTLSSRLFKIFAGLFLFATSDGAAQELIERKPMPLVQAPTEQEVFVNKKRTDPDYARQTWIKGRVIAEETQEPVAGAWIRMDGQNYSARSDSAGFFKLLVPDSLATVSNRFTVVEPYIGRKSLKATVSDFPEVIELSYEPKKTISTGGLVVEKRKWWQWRRRKLESLG